MRYFKNPNGDVFAYDADQSALAAAAVAAGWQEITGEWPPPVDVSAAAAVPVVVSAFQARAALHAVPSKSNPSKNMLDDVNAYMASPGVDPVAALAWEYSNTVERTGKFIATLAPSLGLTDADLDSLFTAAAAITG